MTDARLVPLLPEQRHFLARRLPGAHHWNQADLFTIPAQLDAATLRRAATAVYARHEGLCAVLLRWYLVCEAGERRSDGPYRL